MKNTDEIEWLTITVEHVTGRGIELVVPETLRHKGFPVAYIPFAQRRGYVHQFLVQVATVAEINTIRNVLKTNSLKVIGQQFADAETNNISWTVRLTDQ